jgi:hypothetical protein
LSGELSDFAIPIAIGVVVATSISSVAAYACSKRRATKTYVGFIIAYWVGAALILARWNAPNHFDRVYFLDSLVSLSPIIFIPGLLLLLCVLGKRAPRAIIPIALFGVVVAAPIVVYLGLVSSCYILHDCP